jgi:hypothetical protein
MTGLATLQRALAARVLRGDIAIEAFVPGTESFPTRARLGVYEHAYRARLESALAQNYPALQAALGVEGFAALAADYLDCVPPRHWSIRWFGDRLADHLAIDTDDPAAAAQADLARFEWTLAAAFDAADVAPLPKSALAARPVDEWAGLSFRFAPSLGRLVTSSNAVQWWRALRADGARPSGWEAAAPTEWLVWRAGLTPRFRSLPADEVAALDAASGGETLARLCESLLAFHPPDAAPARAVTLLHTWFDDGLIVAIDPAR